MMFKKILIANRGEIATRIIRTCREMGILTVALYTSADRDSLHVRLADEVKLLQSPNRYGDADEVLAIAKATGAEAIHPGYGFLAEEAGFAERCAAEGIVFIGSPPPVIRAVRSKMEAMEAVKRAGYRVPLYADLPDADADEAALQQVAKEVGFPLVVKSARGGRGRGARVVLRADRLIEAVRAARHEAELIYGDDHLYLERVIAPSHYLVVQVLADAHGNIVHLGEREGSLLRHNQKLIEESPSPSLNDTQRAALWTAAVDIARLFNFQNTGAVEFLVDSAGNFHFTEVKARIQIEHGVSEMLSDIDIVREQIRIAAGEKLARTQEEIRLDGWAMQCRINAEDPWNDYLPSPGRLTRFRLPQGPDVRVDTYGYVGCAIPERFDPLLANLLVKGDDRAMCVSRLRRALMEFRIVGVQTNLALHKQIVQDPAFIAGNYDTRFMERFQFDVSANTSREACRDLVAMTAVAYLLRRRVDSPVVPERIKSGWHRSARRLPS
ncbi:MAG TPA: biotin carboxylase N-terminal domain-containing protein [Caldilinea sp.]|nr:biotin carboxylase N-terminal domain-containing protein [Caldilinea sp.]